MICYHLFYIAALICFTNSEPADDEPESARGPLKRRLSDSKCYCGSLYLPDYNKDDRENFVDRKFRVLTDDIYAFEKYKSKKYFKKCSCVRIKGLEDDGVNLGYQDGYQIDRYQDTTSESTDFDSERVQGSPGNYGKFERILMKTRQRRDSEMDKTGVQMNLQDDKKDLSTAVLKETEEIVSLNKNKSAQVLEKIGYGLGVASDVVQKVGDQVGSTIGGKMAQSVLNQVSFGLGLASETARSLAESKRSGEKKKRSINDNSSFRDSFKKKSYLNRI